MCVLVKGFSIENKNMELEKLSGLLFGKYQ